MVLAHYMIDHLTNRERFSAATRRVFGDKPVEATVGVVRCLLLRHVERKPVTFRQRRPSGPSVVSLSILRASVKDDNQRAFWRKTFGDKRIHPQVTRVGAEA